MFSNLNMHNIYVIFSVSDTSQTTGTTILEYHIILTIYASSDPGTKNTLFKEKLSKFFGEIQVFVYWDKFI